MRKSQRVRKFKTLGFRKVKHKEFRLLLAAELMKDSLADNPTTHRRRIDPSLSPERQQVFYVKRSDNLIHERFSQQMPHLPMYHANRKRCYLCRYLIQCNEDSGKKSESCSAQTYISCSFCNVPLCLTASRNCFYNYHTKEY